MLISIFNKDFEHPKSVPLSEIRSHNLKMSYKFKIDDQDALEIVQGEDRTIVFRMMDEHFIPINLTGADVTLRMPRADSVGIMKRSSVKPTFLASDINISEDTITIESHGLVKNDKIQLSNSGGSLPTGLLIDTDYYVIVVDEDTIQLSDSVDGSAINVTATGSGTNTVEFSPIITSGTNHALLGTAVLTLDENATLALKAGEKQAIEFEYTIAGSTRVIPMPKALTVYEQSVT